MNHVVQLYQEIDPLADRWPTTSPTGSRRGEAAIIIATPEHRAAFLARLGRSRRQSLEDPRCGTDAGEVHGERHAAVEAVPRSGRRADRGAAPALPTVCAYGEMVDVLWQRGERDAAIRLEEYWNDLGELQTFSLFCAYTMDPLESASYGGPLESVCKVHSHLIPTRDAARFDEAVSAASSKVLDEPLAQLLLSLAANHQTATQMPAGQAALFWLKQNMPRTAEKVLSELREGFSPAG